MQDLFDQSVLRRAQTGFHSDSDTEIREVLSEGDLVVANAGSSLRGGDRVKPVLAEVTGPGQA
jgi:HlyD family secretion protein